MDIEEYVEKEAKKNMIKGISKFIARCVKETWFKVTPSHKSSGAMWGDYYVWCGTYKGIKVSICKGGMSGEKIFEIAGSSLNDFTIRVFKFGEWVHEFIIIMFERLKDNLYKKAKRKARKRIDKCEEDLEYIEGRISGWDL